MANDGGGVTGMGEPVAGEVEEMGVGVGEEEGAEDGVEGGEEEGVNIIMLR